MAEFDQAVTNLERFIGLLAATLERGHGLARGLAERIGLLGHLLQARRQGRDGFVEDGQCFVQARHGIPPRRARP